MQSARTKFIGFFLATIFGASFNLLALAQQASNDHTLPVAPIPGTKDSDQFTSRKLLLQGVHNFGEVNATLFRGGQPTTDGFDNLVKMGIKMIVDLRDGARTNEQEQVHRLGMEYVAIPWRCGHPDDKDVAQFLSLLRANSGKKIFVHCYYGTDRTGMMVAAYRMTEQGWTAAQARKEMQFYGFSHTHRLMCPGLASYEENFPAEFETSPSFQNLRAPKPADDPTPKP